MAPKNFMKNAACVSLSLFLISLSSLLMVRMHFQSEIDSQIQNISILKDIRYPSWGKNPNPSGSQYNQTFTLFNLEQIDGQIHSTKSNITKFYEYNFQYQNTSFAQGNSGRLNFINKWQLKQIKTPSENSNIKTLNLAADKVFNYDYYAPPQRKFAILYNYILDTMTGSFLEKFYAAYLHQFFFKQKQLVIDTVFKPFGFDAERASKIYDHSELGWSNVSTFQIWVKLSLKGSNYAAKTMEYESLVTDLQLSTKQIQQLIFEKSTLFNMIFALNGTIKSKLMMAGAANFNYKCSQASCSNQQLAAFQIAAGFLTSDALFASLNLNKLTKDMNSTFLTDIQYTKFCQRNKGKFVCMSKANMVKFFMSNYLGDFQSMHNLWKNLNKYDAIERMFDLEENTGRSVSQYIQYLYSQMIGKYDNDFAWAQTSYNHIQNTVQTYKNLFLVELYSRAFFNKFIQKKEVKCQDYFVGDFSDYANDACIADGTSQSWNFVKYFPSLRNYMKAYLFIQGLRNQMSQTLNMPFLNIITFFNNPDVSLFASQVQQIESIFKSNFACLKNDLSLCTPEQLFCMQWGSNKIFQNLPIEIFSNKIKNINEWDTFNVLNGLNPDYHAITGKQKSVDKCLSILSSNSKDGIFNIFNILQLSKNSSDSQSKDMLKYIGKNVMQISFRGIVNSQTAQSLFNGFKSDLIKQKNQMSVQSGGAPWLLNQVKLIKTDNKVDIKNNQMAAIPQFDTIDTGIYNQDQTRQITKVWGQSYSSSKYTLYHGTKTDDEGNEVIVDLFQKRITDRKVAGTNLLGFHPFIQTGQNLQTFVSQAYQPMTLSFVQQVSIKDAQNKQIKAYNYSIVLNSRDSNDDSFIGIQQLNQNYFSLAKNGQSGSYAIVQPTSGLTLKLHLSYTIKSSPLYTKFLMGTSGDSVNLYSSDISYQRKGYSQIYNIIQNQDKLHLFTIICIAAGAGSFIASIIFLIVYRRLRNKYSTSQQTLLQNQEQAEA